MFLPLCMNRMVGTVALVNIEPVPAWTCRRNRICSSTSAICASSEAVCAAGRFSAFKKRWCTVRIVASDGGSHSPTLTDMSTTIASPTPSLIRKSKKGSRVNVSFASSLQAAKKSASSVG